MTERELQNTLLETCQALDLPAFHVHDSRREVRDRDGRRSLVGDIQAQGYPDLTVARRGETLWAELKGPRGRLETAQVTWLDRLPEHRAFVWRVEDLDQAMAILGGGHPEGICRSCWSCSREEIIKRVGTRRRGR